MVCSSPPFPSRALPSYSALMLREQAAPAVVFWSSSFADQHFPTSVLLQEQRDEYRPLLHMDKEDKTSQMVMTPVHEKCNIGNADQLVHDFVQQLRLQSHLHNLLTSSPVEEIAASSTPQPVAFDSERPADGLQWNAVSLAKQALSASEQAVSIAEELKLIKADHDRPLPFGLASTSLDYSSPGKNKIVRSTRPKEKRSKQRKVSNSKVRDEESYLARKSNVQGRLHVGKKIKEGFDQNDPLRLFFWGPETKQLLTREEESQLIAQLQDLLRLEEVKIKLQSQFGREPTLAEWADGVGLSCHALQTQLHCGNRSKEKLIHANLRMVFHIAKHYQGRGLSLQDLLQEGTMGLVKCVEKFKPQHGCRFGTYAYWWIRQSIRKGIFLHSKTIRLPQKQFENLYTLLGKVMEAKKLFIEEGNLYPTKEELAGRVGITVAKMENLLFSARIPRSMQQTLWADRGTTFQETTADSAIEIPDVSVAKQQMRRHVRNLLNILSPRERKIIRLRFGIDGGYEKSFEEIGHIFGVSRERVQHLHHRALDKLKQSLVSQGLDAYIDLLV
ncbi:RNA polymerase sigma factor sigF, chloroplastic-like isoform X2 [Gastrolobium bilobum]|uniref:RNA polymerase sigma factor sigF, chloroplastic-like isoform X2 n=1 Tax=Gastrolobium bilobum TaxID=150636 RepID=UPI002AB1D9A3|nr:RNA polymerase sigma factor sigF, chloroplastic-like isoform X2 [Gastrolobium bilobum]